MLIPFGGCIAIVFIGIEVIEPMDKDSTAHDVVFMVALFGGLGWLFVSSFVLRVLSERRREREKDNPDGE